MHGMHAATSKVENLAQDSSCKLKFVLGNTYNMEGRVSCFVWLLGVDHDAVRRLGPLGRRATLVSAKNLMASKKVQGIEKAPRHSE